MAAYTSYFFKKLKAKHILKAVFLQVNQDNLFKYCCVQYTLLDFEKNTNKIPGSSTS